MGRARKIQKTKPTKATDYSLTLTDQIENKMLFQSATPLQIDMVLDNIFSHLPLVDLKSCRAVCSQWNDRATLLIVKKKGLKVAFSNRDKLFPEKLPNKVREFTKIMKLTTPERNPYGSYEFSDLTIASDYMKRFFEVCGRNINRLELSATQSRQMNANTFSQLISTHVPCLQTLVLERIPKSVLQAAHLHPGDGSSPVFLPNLKSFTLNYDGLDGSLGGIWTEFFASAPNLSEVNVTTDYWTRHDNDSFGHPIVRSLLRSGRLGNMKKLMFGYLHSRDLKILHRAAIQQEMELEEFNVKCVLLNPVPDFNMAPIVVDNSLHNFLQSQAKCLKSLSLGQMDPLHNDSFGMELPKMENLTSICIVPESAIECGFNFTIKNINAPADLPKLQSVQICTKHIKNIIPALMTTPFTSVISLNAHFKRSSPDIIITLGKLFPSLQSLRLYAPSCCQVRALWKIWPNLKKLELVLNKGVKCKNINGWDETFANYPRSIENMLPELNNHLENNNIDEIRKLLYPSVCDLTNLQSLIIKTSSVFGTSQKPLSDASGMLLFSNMTHLRELQILGESKITDHCKTYIRSHLPYLQTQNIIDTTYYYDLNCMT